MDSGEKIMLVDPDNGHRTDGSNGAMNESRGGSTYEEAMSEAGYGCFHYGTLVLCGWALSSDGVEVLSLAFALPAASCDLHLTPANKGWITAIVFIGMFIGSIAWGLLSDMHGRRRALLCSLVLNGMGGLAASFSPNFTCFIIFRFISGVGVGGSLPVAYTYLAELQPKEQRNKTVIILESCWLGGGIVAAALAWITIPFGHLGDLSDDYPYNSWRLFLVVTTLPALTSAVGFYFMPESPKYLMEVGLEEAALKVFRRIFRENNRSGLVNSTFSITRLDCPTQKVSSDRCASQPNYVHPTMAGLKESWAQFLRLFREPLTQTTIVSTVIYVTLAFGYFGMFMWFPEVFALMEMYGGSPCNIGSRHVGHMIEAPCDPNLSSSIYFQCFLTTLFVIPAAAFTIVFLDKIGRRLLLGCGMILSGVSVFFIAVLNNATQGLIFSCAFSGIVNICWNALDILWVDLYPTQLRATSRGYLMAMSRLGAITANLVFGNLVEVYCFVPMFLVSALMSVGGLMAALVPRSTTEDLK